MKSLLLVILLTLSASASMKGFCKSNRGHYYDYMRSSLVAHNLGDTRSRDAQFNTAKQTFYELVRLCENYIELPPLEIHLRDRLKQWAN